MNVSAYIARLNIVNNSIPMMRETGERKFRIARLLFSIYFPGICFNANTTNVTLKNFLTSSTLRSLFVAFPYSINSSFILVKPAIVLMIKKLRNKESYSRLT